MDASKVLRQIGWIRVGAQVGTAGASGGELSQVPLRGFKMFRPRLQAQTEQTNVYL